MEKDIEEIKKSVQENLYFLKVLRSYYTDESKVESAGDFVKLIDTMIKKQEFVLNNL